MVLLQTTLADIPYLGLLLTIIGILFGALVWILNGIWNTLKTRFVTLENDVGVLKADQTKLSSRQDTFELKLEMFNRDLKIKDLEKQNQELISRLHTKI